MKRSGRPSTTGTWKKRQKPPVKKPRGCRHKRTILKEAIGLQNWEGLQKFIEENGASRLIVEMQKLRKREYVQAYVSLCEFVKPKLTRVAAEVTGPKGLPLLSATDLTKEEIQHIADCLENR